MGPVFTDSNASQSSLPDTYTVLVIFRRHAQSQTKAFGRKNQTHTETLAHSLFENGASIAHYKKLCNKKLNGISQPQPNDQKTRIHAC